MKLLKHLGYCCRLLVTHIVRNFLLGAYTFASLMCFVSAFILNKIDRHSSHVITVTIGNTKYSITTDGLISKEN